MQEQLEMEGIEKNAYLENLLNTYLDLREEGIHIRMKQKSVAEYIQIELEKIGKRELHYRGHDFHIFKSKQGVRARVDKKK